MGAVGPISILAGQAVQAREAAAERAREREITLTGVFGRGLEAVTGVFETIGEARAIRARRRVEERQLETARRRADLLARDILFRGRRESERHLVRTRTLIGAQRAALAAQGVDVSTGSPLAVQLETAALGAADALTIRNNAFREAFGFRVRAVELGAQERLERLAAIEEERATLLTGGLRLARQTVGGVRFLQRRGAV